MPILTVGPTSTYSTIAAAMAAATAGDEISLQSGYSSESVTDSVQNMFVTGRASSSNIDLTLGAGIDMLTLMGHAPIDVFDNSANNTITGNNGANAIHISAGVDVVHGGGGIDRLIVDYSTDTSTITGTTVNITDGGTHAVTFDGVENFTIETGSGSDTITAADGDNIFATLGGNDTITSGGGQNDIHGGQGNDTITAGDGGNLIAGGVGDDTITSGNGKDLIKAGLGNDTVIAGGGNDKVIVAGGIDTVDGRAGQDLLVVHYAHSTSVVTGGVGTGSFAGGYSGTIAEGAGTASTVFDFVEHFRVTTGSGNDNILTGDGSDVLIGNAGRDTLAAGGGNDKIHGDAGNDILTGGLGEDRMNGGLGADTFVYQGTADSLRGSKDTIMDFNHGQGDLIDLHSIDANTMKAGNQAFSFIGTSAFSGHARELHYAVNAHGDAVVSGDVNGDGKADFAITLHSTAHLMATDFGL